MSLRPSTGVDIGLFGGAVLEDTEEFQQGPSPKPRS
jgi:hypothetical protein